MDTEIQTDFSIACRRYGPVARIAPQGEVDITTAQALDQAVQRALDAGARVLVVDLGRVEFIDSTGLSTLLNAKAETERDGGTLQVCEVQPFHRRLFEVTGLDTVLDLVDEEAAVSGDS